MTGNSLNNVGFYLIIGTAGFLVVLLIVFLCVFPKIREKNIMKKYKNYYYKVIRKIVDVNDYYLINNLALRDENTVFAQIDHIMFGEKFIYVIKDKYYRGAVKANKNDQAWIFYDFNKQNKEIENPMMVNMKRLEKLSLMTGIDQSLFISIIIINDDCVISNLNDLNSDNSFITSRKKLKKLIKMLESRDVAKLDENQLSYAVKDISKLYGTGDESSDE